MQHDHNNNNFNVFEYFKKPTVFIRTRLYHAVTEKNTNAV